MFLLTVMFILIALLILGYHLTDSGYEILELLGFFSYFVAFFWLCFSALAVFFWFSAEYKAEIINREYNTSYSPQEVFFASSTIDTIRHLNRQRIELDGDLLSGCK